MTTSAGIQLNNTTYNSALDSVQTQTRGEVEIIPGKGLGTADGNIRFGDSTKNNIKIWLNNLNTLFKLILQRIYVRYFYK